MPKIAIRVPDTLYERIQSEAQQRGFESASALVRQAIQAELRQGDCAVSEMEARLAGTVSRLAKEIHALHTGQLATFALVDSLVKVLLTCVPEPPDDALEGAKARARRRYEKFLLSVAQGMSGESRGALKELSRVDN